MCEVLTGVRVRAEGVGIMGKTLATCLVLWCDSMYGTRSGEYALLAFATGQLSYGILVFTTYAIYFRGISLWPTSPNVSKT